MTSVEVYPGQRFLSIRQNGAVDDGHLQKVAIGEFSRKNTYRKVCELTIVDRTMFISFRR